MALGLLVSIAVLAVQTVLVPDGVTLPPRVRSTDAAILELLREGGQRSKTFHGLLDTIAQSRVIVYVEWGYCAFGRLMDASCRSLRRRTVTTPDAFSSPDKSRRNHDQLIAVIGHELRHAVEVSQHEGVVDTATVEALYRRIGTPLGDSLRGYETSAARAAGDAVLSELPAPRAGR